MKKKAGVFLIMLGIFVPLATVPFAKNYRPQMGIMGNIQRMVLPLATKSYPEFKVKNKLDIFDDVGTTLVQYDNTSITFIFPNTMAEAEMKKAIKYIFQDGAKLNIDQKQYYDFVKWNNQTIELKYRYVFLMCLAFSFGGLGIIIFDKLKK